MKRKIDLRMYPFVKLVIPLGLGIVVGDTIWDIFPVFIGGYFFVDQSL